MRPGVVDPNTSHLNKARHLVDLIRVSQALFNCCGGGDHLRHRTRLKGVRNRRVVKVPALLQLLFQVAVRVNGVRVSHCQHFTRVRVQHHCLATLGQRVRFRLLKRLLDKGLQIQVNGQLDIRAVNRRHNVAKTARNSKAVGGDILGRTAVNTGQDRVTGGLQAELAVAVHANLAQNVFTNRAIRVLADVLVVCRHAVETLRNLCGHIRVHVAYQHLVVGICLQLVQDLAGRNVAHGAVAAIVHALIRLRLAFRNHDRNLIGHGAQDVFNTSIDLGVDVFFRQALYTQLQLLLLLDLLAQHDRRNGQRSCLHGIGQTLALTVSDLATARNIVVFAGALVSSLDAKFRAPHHLHPKQAAN